LIRTALASFISDWWHRLKLLASLPARLAGLLWRLTWRLASFVLDFLGSIFRPALRFLSFVFFVLATVSFVADFTPVLSATGEYRSTTVFEHIAAVAPTTLDGLKGTIAGLKPAWLWPNLVFFLLGLPTSLLLFVLGATCAIGGRRKHRISVYAN